MEAFCSGNVRANRLSTLAQAADRLAKAAATLSEAARAAAESFSSDLLDIPAALNSVSKSGLNGDESEDQGSTNPDDTGDYVSDDGDELGERAESPVQLETNESQPGFVGACFAGPMTIDQLRFDPNRPPPVASVSTEFETTAGLAYRILVEREYDVLLFVCALIQHRRKVICYMNCSIPAFHMYKKLINDVTAMDVYTITKITTAEIIQVGQRFLEADRSILLLPETTTPSIEIDEIDSWVIHVGWPSDEQRFEEQRLIHQAQNSIVVACSEDEELYPAGAAIMWQSQPWPGDVESFRVSVAALRSVFDEKLKSIPAEMKAKIYPDWISCHGCRGNRYVKSWNAATLVQKANSFLLDVLKYEAPGFIYPLSESQFPFPEVSQGFILHNGLELAAREGLLQIKDSGSGLNHISSLPKTDWASSTSESERGAASPTVAAPAKPSGQLNSSPRSHDHANIASISSTAYRQWHRRYPVADLNSARATFKSTPGHTYFTINEEFEAIPLMCFLATSCTPTVQKAVLFFDISGCRAQYRTLIEDITGWRVFVREDTENHHEDVVSNFVDSQGPGILLLPFKMRSLPSPLKGTSLGYCVYWGSTLTGFVPLAQAKKHQSLLKCQYTSIIMTTEQVNKISPYLVNSDFKVHPSSADLLHRNDSRWLSELRLGTRSVLFNSSKLIQELYEGHLRTIGKASGALAAEEIASRVNKFTANVLLTGDPEDGSDKYPPIAGRLVTPLSTVNELNLQAAVDAGILYVW